MLGRLEDQLRQLERYSDGGLDGNTPERFQSTIRALRAIADYAEQGLLFDRYDVAGPGQDDLHVWRSVCEGTARDEVVKRITELRRRSSDYITHLIAEHKKWEAT